ncbi:TPA: anti-phage dCTP deaminase [Serratia liquefaciens]
MDIIKIIEKIPEDKKTEIIITNNSTLQEKIKLIYSEEPPSELVIGLVCSVGTDLESLTLKIKERLTLYDFNCEEIRISKDVISEITKKNSFKDNYERIDGLMTLGNKIREDSECNYILALGAITKINEIRKKSKTTSNQPKGIAYIINSIKHPEEVEELRKIYGNGFYLFGVFADKERRLKNLVDHKGVEKSKALKLIERDENEDDGHGQHTRDTYHLSDFFISQDGNDDRLKNDIKRIFELLFSNPFITPTFDEFAMYMAFSSALRSADLSRQVGAVIAKNKNIISTGANDVPQFGGGLYWPDYEDDEIVDFPLGRDYTRGVDSNVEQKNEIIEDIISKIPKKSQDNIRKILKKSKIKDITEYGRVVHAEMEAIIACARGNISTIDTSIYCTTFPCHNCAKHIIASGIKRVIYIEPYPKSKAFDFHNESTTNDRKVIEKVLFEPFIGIGPKVFFSLFSIANGGGRPLIRKDKDGKVKVWSENTASLRTKMLPVSYFEKEQLSVMLFGAMIGVKDAN